MGRQFIGGQRLDDQVIWNEYVYGKQTYLQLSIKYGCSLKTIQRRINKYEIATPEVDPKRIVVLMDTTYWGRGFGLMLFKDAISKQNLLKYYVKTETNAQYIKGVNLLKNKGFVVDGIVCDGRKGLIQAFGGIPVQMCQFHQAAIIRRYVTKNPKLPAAKELLKIVDLMKQTDKESFAGVLSDWSEKWESFLNERTINKETGKSFFTHKRLRSAHRSLKTNLSYLFTWYENMGLGIPNTTNAIDGHFADLKNKLRNHNGLSQKSKIKFIDEFLKA